MSAAQRQGKAIVATGNWKPSTASDAICCWKATCSQFIAASLPIPVKNGVMMPVKNPMSGTGLRWKPLRDQIFFLAVEQQLPLNGQNGASDTMLRASASFFNGGKYSDEWHPNGSGWFAQNLYLDAAQYIRPRDIQAWTADYRVSWHQKVANGQTIEPYAHVQDNGYRDKGTQGAQLGGVGGPLEYLDRRDALRRLAAQSQSRHRISTYL